MLNSSTRLNTLAKPGNVSAEVVDMFRLPPGKHVFLVKCLLLELLRTDIMLISNQSLLSTYEIDGKVEAIDAPAS